MKIGTVSFELKKDTMAIDASKRIEIIEDIVKNNDLDLVLCAGYTVDNNNDLSILATKLGTLKTKTVVVLEVKTDDEILNKGHLIDGITFQHKMFVIDPATGITALGPQFFATSGELDEKTHGKVVLEGLEKHINDRFFSIGDKKALALCCGEINVLRGRDQITCLSDSINDAISSADVIVNPTHDGMANYGTLIAKRKHLSMNKDNRNRCYVSSSNWNTKKNTAKGTISQTRHGRTIQSVFVNGQESTMKSNTDTAGVYEFRLVNVEL